MFSDHAITGSWDALAARLDRAGAMYRWAAAEPALAGIESVTDLVELTAIGADRARADGVLGGLVRTAAAAGGDVCDAVLVVVHLLSPGLVALGRDIKNLSDCALDLAVAEACCQVRAFPIARRRRAIAANILLDTRKALLAELLVARSERPLDPTSASTAAIVDAATKSECDDLPRLSELLTWAVASNVVSAADADLLRHLAAHGGYGSAVRARTAERLGCGVRTVSRRRATAVAALRECAPRFLQEIS